MLLCKVNVSKMYSVIVQEDLLRKCTEQSLNCENKSYVRFRLLEKPILNMLLF